MCCGARLCCHWSQQLTCTECPSTTWTHAPVFTVTRTRVHSICSNLLFAPMIFAWCLVSAIRVSMHACADRWMGEIDNYMRANPRLTKLILFASSWGGAVAVRRFDGQSDLSLAAERRKWDLNEKPSKAGRNLLSRSTPTWRKFKMDHTLFRATFNFRKLRYKCRSRQILPIHLKTS